MPALERAPRLMRYLQKLQQAVDTNKNVETKVAAVMERIPLLSKSRRGARACFL